MTFDQDELARNELYKARTGAPNHIFFILEAINFSIESELGVVIDTKGSSATNMQQVVNPEKPNIPHFEFKIMLRGTAETTLGGIFEKYEEAKKIEWLTQAVVNYQKFLDGRLAAGKFFGRPSGIECKLN